MLPLNVWGTLGDSTSETLRVPVEVRYDATDVLVPAAHGEWLAAHITHATVTIDAHSGHLSAPDQPPDRLRALAGV